MLVALPLFLVAALPAQDLDVYFEAKLLVRERAWFRRAEVDQWSGGRLRLENAPGGDDGAVAYRLTRVLESPWTFRWYPTRDEVKLGAAVHVERAAGRPYDALARRLEPLARAKYATWWDRDEPASGPAWAAETGRFWAERHSLESAEKDRLPPDPTYPFHVLGPLAGRFEVVLRDGAVERIVERMTSPWLPDGWARSLAGEPVEGYGYWERRRPHWEPRTYETFAAALALLAPDSDGHEANLERLLRAMQPLAHDIAARDRAGLRFRVWSDEGDRSREFQMLVDDPGDGSFKFWVRVGYRATPRRTP